MSTLTKMISDKQAIISPRKQYIQQESKPKASKEKKKLNIRRNVNEIEI